MSGSGSLDQAFNIYIDCVPSVDPLSLSPRRPPPATTSVPATIPEEDPLETPSSSEGRWLRFSDILVDEFTMGDTALEAECFGGSYKAKSGDGECVQGKNIVYSQRPIPLKF